MSDAYMSPDMPDISQMAPATGSVGAPASGTYGEGGPLQQLRDTLPAPTPGAGRGGQGGPGLPAPSSGPLPLPPPSGALPRGIMAPSTRPHEPLATPLTQPMPVGETPKAQMVQRLQAWARDPELHETTRAWAQANLDRLGQ